MCIRDREGVKLKLLELRGLPAQILIMVVHKYGGIVGPAHPYGEKYLSLIKTQARKKFHEERLKSLMEQFDFVEVFNACESEEVNEKARKLARKYHKPGFGGSDEMCIRDRRGNVRGRPWICFSLLI